MDVRLKTNFLLNEVPPYHPKYDKLEYLDF